MSWHLLILAILAVLHLLAVLLILGVLLSLLAAGAYFFVLHKPNQAQNDQDGGGRGHNPWAETQARLMQAIAFNPRCNVSKGD
jgi:flagellar basal body-associated protein FliL